MQPAMGVGYSFGAGCASSYRDPRTELRLSGFHHTTVPDLDLELRVHLPLPAEIPPLGAAVLLTFPLELHLFQQALHPFLALPLLKVRIGTSSAILRLRLLSVPTAGGSMSS